MTLCPSCGKDNAVEEAPEETLAAEETVAEEVVAAEEAVAEETAVEEVAVVEETDDLELIAVITAAIAAQEGTSTDGFVVRSIRRRPSNNWN